GGGGRGPNGVVAGPQSRVERDLLPVLPGPGAREALRGGQHGAVDRDVHRPVGGGAVGEPEGQAGRTGRGGAHVSELDEAAGHVVVVDETGAGEPGVVGLDDALGDRGVLGLQVGGRCGRGVDVDEVDVGPAVGGGGGRP